MKNYKEQFKKDSENIKLSADAKSDIFRMLQDEMVQNPLPVPQRSFLFTYRLAFASFGIVFLGVTSTFAAELSDPGDLLHPIKIHVNERVYESLAFTSEAQAEVRITLVERRLEEMRNIIEDNTAETDEIEFIEDEIEEHTFEVSKLARSNKIKDKERAENAIVRLSNSLEAHNEVLKTLTDDDSPALTTTTSIQVRDDRNTSETIDTIIEVTELSQKEKAEVRKATFAEIRDTIKEISFDIEDTRNDLEMSVREEEEEEEEGVNTNITDVENIILEEEEEEEKLDII